MSISSPITEEMAHKLDEALERASKGQHDPKRLGKVIEAMNRSREETRKRVGTINVSVDLIRDARNQ